MRVLAPPALLCLVAFGAHGEDAAPDKDSYTMFDPTPVLRAFSTDRPPRANSPYTVDAGHVQYETDLAIHGFGDSDGVRVRDWTVFDPTLKLGLTDTIDAEPQITPYESTETTVDGKTARASGFGDIYARVKVDLIGGDRGPLAIVLPPYVKLPTAR